MKQFVKHFGVWNLLIFFIYMLVACQSPPSEDTKLQIRAKKVTVRVFSADKDQEMGGSGVVIERNGDRYLVVTNDHVVSDRDTGYKVQTFDGDNYDARIISPPQERGENDLALLTFTAPGKDYRAIAIGSPARGPEEEAVLAGGFPFLDDLHQSRDFRWTTGKVIILLDRPFIGGYKIGYTNTVKSGMSGGPVVNQKGELIGINGLAKDPPLGNPYLFQDGRGVSDSAWEQASQLSWAIPGQTIQEFVRQYHR